MSFIGGYAIVDLSDYPVTLAQATGTISVKVDPSIVAKLKDIEKPAMIVGLNVTANGTHISVAGFGAHVVTQGALHTHYFNNVSLVVFLGDTLRITIS